ncbi:hypothetical protein [Ferruginibacter sp.]
MKKHLIAVVALVVSVMILASCKKDAEALEIQKPYTYDEQYYSNLRAYKKTESHAFLWLLCSVCSYTGR